MKQGETKHGCKESKWLCGRGSEGTCPPIAAQPADPWLPGSPRGSKAVTWPQFGVRKGPIRKGWRGDSEGKRGTRCSASLLAVTY